MTISISWVVVASPHVHIPTYAIAHGSTQFLFVTNDKAGGGDEIPCKAPASSYGLSLLLF